LIEYELSTFETVNHRVYDIRRTKSTYACPLVYPIGNGVKPMDAMLAVMALIYGFAQENLDYKGGKRIEEQN
jgi:hypothetical protein